MKYHSRISEFKLQNHAIRQRKLPNRKALPCYFFQLSKLILISILKLEKLQISRTDPRKPWENSTHLMILLTILSTCFGLSSFGRRQKSWRTLQNQWSRRKMKKRAFNFTRKTKYLYSLYVFVTRICILNSIKWPIKWNIGSMWYKR